MGIYYLILCVCLQMVFLPEAFDFISTSSEESLNLAEDIEGPVMMNYRNIAKKLQVWLSLGGFHKKTVRH